MSYTPEINTKHCLLVRISEDEIPVLKEIFDDIETRKFLPELYELLDFDDGTAKFASIFDLYAQNDEGFLWGIKHRGLLIGFVAIMDFSCSPTLFYAMHRNYRSQGYMKESIREIILYLHKTKKCSYIQTEVYETNISSISLLKSIGFVKTDKRNNKIYFKYEMSTLWR